MIRVLQPQDCPIGVVERCAQCSRGLIQSGTFGSPCCSSSAVRSACASCTCLATVGFLHRALLAAATLDNTRCAYRSALRHYLASGGVLPGDEADAIRYLLDYSQSLDPRTLALGLTALSQWHIHQGFPDPASTATVRKTLAGIERVHGKPRK